MPSVILRFFLKRAEQRELMRAGHLRRSLDLHLGDLVCVDACDADALCVYGPHYLEGVAVRLAEDFPIDLAQVVAGNIFPVFGKFDRETVKRTAMRARDVPFDN